MSAQGIVTEGGDAVAAPGAQRVEPDPKDAPEKLIALIATLTASNARLRKAAQAVLTAKEEVEIYMRAGVMQALLDDPKAIKARAERAFTELRAALAGSEG